MTIFCDDCSNFPPPESKRWGDCTKRIYLCDKGIRMNFALPTSPIDDEWGFQKERCAQFSQKEQCAQFSQKEQAKIVYGIKGLVQRKKVAE